MLRPLIGGADQTAVLNEIDIGVWIPHEDGGMGGYDELGTILDQLPQSCQQGQLTGGDKADSGSSSR